MTIRKNLKLIILSKFISFLFSILSFSFKKINILQHNGKSVFNYPENEWNLIPFPSQKGRPFNADNLSTVNKHSFLSDLKFQKAKEAGDSRWSSLSFVRDISWRLNIFLWAFGQNINHPNIKGSIFVECGTGYGYCAAAATTYFNFNENSPIFYLYDKFDKMHVSVNKPYKKKQNNFINTDAYTDDLKEVKNYFFKYPTVKIIQANLPEKLDKISQKPILFLHIDLNSAIVEKKILTILCKNFVTGTIILFDDYGGPGPGEQAKVHENFAKENKKNLLTLPTGQALII